MTLLVSDPLLGKMGSVPPPAVKKLTSWPSMDEIVSAVKMELGENGDLTRKVSIFFCRKYSGAKLKEIGERFGIRDAEVSQASRRLGLKAGEDQQLKMMISISRLEVGLGDERC